MSSDVSRWLTNVRLRSRDEDASSSGTGGRRSAGATRSVASTGGSRCFVSVARHGNAGGAARARYHERDGAETVRDAGLDRWEGPRWSIVVAPEDSTVDMSVFASTVLSNLEDRFGKLEGHAVIHRDAGRPTGSEKDHIHLIVKDARVHISSRAVESAVKDAMKSMSCGRTRALGASR